MPLGTQLCCMCVPERGSSSLDQLVVLFHYVCSSVLLLEDLKCESPFTLIMASLYIRELHIRNTIAQVCNMQMLGYNMGHKPRHSCPLSFAVTSGLKQPLTVHGIVNMFELKCMVVNM